MNHRLFPTLCVSWARRALSALTVAVLGLLAAACSPESPAGQDAAGQLVHGLPVEAPSEGHRVGKQAPVFTLRLADNSTITSTEIIESGRPTFLFFWATT